MVSISNDERLAVFLNLLGDKAVDLALGQLSGSRPQQIRQLLGELKKEPATEDEIDYVLQDFDRYFRFAVNSMGGSMNGNGPDFKKGKKAGGKSDKSSKPASSTAAEQLVFVAVEPSNDPAADLDRLHPYQIAKALDGDQPKKIALVLSQMDPNQSAKALEQLPQETRLDTFMLLSQPVTVPMPIVRKVLRSTFDKANTIRESLPVVDRTEQLVAMLRNMPKAIRGEIMARLKEELPELAEDIQSKLYCFEDILRLEDRAVQTVLTKIASDRLVMALTRAEEDITKKILGNMSKRARETMEEEIGFNERAVEKDIETARADIAQTLAKMDEAGEISL